MFKCNRSKHSLCWLVFNLIFVISALIFIQTKYSTLATASPLTYYDARDYGIKSDEEEPYFNNTSNIQAAINDVSNAGGGVLKFPPNKTYYTKLLRPKSNVTIDLNGSELRLVAKSGDYTHIFSNKSDFLENFSLINGRLNGNKEAQELTNNHYGVFMTNCNNITLNNLEIVDCDGNGLFVGWTDYLAQNINIDNIKISGSTYNDLVLANVDTCKITNLVINCTTAEVAGIDLEIHSAADVIKNVYIEGKVNDKTSLPYTTKLQTNALITDGMTDNIKLSLISNKGIHIHDFDNVILKDCEFASIEVVDSQNIEILQPKIMSSPGKGIFVYGDNLDRSKNILIDSPYVSDCIKQGIHLQKTTDFSINNPTILNNAIGIRISYDVYGGKVVGGIITDTQDIKTQTYGIELVGKVNNISIVNADLSGNKLGEFSGIDYDNVSFITPKKLL